MDRVLHPKMVLCLLLVSAFLISCKEGEKLANQAPETQIFLEEINLSGNDRLNSVVRMHWSGEDPDGYVAGYELSFDAQAWSFVTVQDSQFRFNIPPGSDTTDISFYVRAIDNEDFADPTPAFLSVPVKNTPPSMVLDTVKLIPDTVYGVFSTLWASEDLDGNETLDSLFIRLNDGPWYPLGRQISFATFVPTEPTQTGTQEAEVFLNLAPSLAPSRIQGLRVGQMNRVYVQARDIAGSLSPIDSSREFYVRPQTSDLLVVNVHSLPEPLELYQQILGQVYPNYDYLDLKNEIPPFWDPTFGIFLQQYDKVFWFGDGLQFTEFGDQMLMEVAGNQLQIFLNQGGKLFVTTKFSNDYNNREAAAISPIFSFSPMDSLSSSSGQARVTSGSIGTPINAFADFDSLECAVFTGGADPFYAKNSSNSVFTIYLIAAGGWVGPNTIGGTTRFRNGEINQVFFSMELHRLNQRPAAVQSLFDRVLNTSFNW
ncbi:MAG: hypothetical protein AAGI38_07285 [Bacteroidota bacterium]